MRQQAPNFQKRLPIFKCTRNSLLQTFYGPEDTSRTARKTANTFRTYMLVKHHNTEEGEYMTKGTDIKTWQAN